MLLSMKGGVTRRKGFSLLEALLAIVIIVAAGLGVAELFTSADKKNKLKATEQTIQQAASATAQLLSTTNDVADTVDTQLVIDSGLMPSNVIVGGTAIVGPYGNITVASDATVHNHYTITTTLPGKQAVTLCQDMFRSAAIGVAGTEEGTTDFINKLADCSQFADTGSNEDTSISFYFPREEYIDSTAATS